MNISRRECLRKFKFLSKILLILDEYRYFSTIKRVLDRNMDLIQLFQLLQNRILYFCLREFAVECNKQTSSEIWNFPSEEGSEFLNFSFHRSLRSATGETHTERTLAIDCARSRVATRLKIGKIEIKNQKIKKLLNSRQNSAILSQI